MNMIGNTYGRLTVLEKTGKDKHGKIKWYCKCTCGNFKEITGVYLRNGDTKSCGCLNLESIGNKRRKHGLSRKNNSEYEIWKGMKARCYNKNHINYHNYGGRGIKVCDRWLHSFENFRLDMGLRPSSIYSIDRYPNVDGNYEPLNCRWATNMQQSRGKRNNRYYSYKGKRMILKDWAEYFNVDPSTLSEHLQKKSFDEVVSFYDNKTNNKTNFETNPEMAKEIEDKVVKLINQ